MSKDEAAKLGSSSKKVASIAEQHQLDNVERAFVVSEQQRRAMLFRFIILIGIIPASVGLFGICFFVLQAHYFVIYAYTCLFLFDAGIFTFVIALKFTLPRFKRLKNEQIIFFVQGLVYFNFRKKALDAIRWEQIGVLDISRKPREQYAISMSIKKMREHRSVLIINLPQREEIIQRIEEAYLAARLPLALQEYEHGDVFDFGICAISQQGIKQSWYIGEYDPQLEREELLPWSEVTAIELGERFFTIYTFRADAGNNEVWLQANLSDIYNLSLFKVLLVHIYPTLKLDI